MVSRCLCQILPLLRPTLRIVPAQSQDSLRATTSQVPAQAPGCLGQQEASARWTRRWESGRPVNGGCRPSSFRPFTHTLTSFLGEQGNPKAGRCEDTGADKPWHWPRGSLHNPILMLHKTSHKKKEEKYEDHNKNLTPELPCCTSHSLYMLRSHQESNLSKLMISWPFNKTRWLPNYEKQTTQTDTAKFFKN